MSGEILPQIARASISSCFGIDCPEPQCPQEFLADGATFVTLTKEGRLRGCIGSLEARRPIPVDIRQNALMAAFRDPRFPPLIQSEYAMIKIEVSLLSSSEPIVFSSENEAIDALHPGIDGVILEFGSKRGTFLPQVWENLPDPEIFLMELKQKAGLARHFWAEEIRLSRYTVSKWRES